MGIGDTFNIFINENNRDGMIRQHRYPVRILESEIYLLFNMSSRDQ